MKKTYFLIVLFLCGLSVENLFAAAPAAGRLGQQLIDAAREGNEPEVERLIAKGTDVNAADQYGRTALIAATIEGHESIVEKLLQAGADVNAAGQGGWTVLIWATVQGHEKIVETLLQVDGIDLNAVNNEGLTALILAAYNGREKIVKMLLDAGADKNIQNINGQTAEKLARNDKIANMIRDYGSGRTVKSAGKR